MATSSNNQSNGTNGGRNGQKERIPLTREGFEALSKELEHLKSVERPKIADYIHEAKEGGDISESSAYEDAKNRQALLEGRIRELQHTLDNAEIMAAPAHKGGKRQAVLGSTVEVETDRGARRALTLVSTVEADSTANKVSDQSPVGRALLGHGVGEKVSVITPGGTVVYTILNIK
jgi:transcription elongation factor GreA